MSSTCPALHDLLTGDAHQDHAWYFELIQFTDGLPMSTVIRWGVFDVFTGRAMGLMAQITGVHWTWHPIVLTLKEPHYAQARHHPHFTQPAWSWSQDLFIFSWFVLLCGCRLMGLGRKKLKSTLACKRQLDVIELGFEFACLDIRWYKPMLLEVTCQVSTLKDFDFNIFAKISTVACQALAATGKLPFWTRTRQGKRGRRGKLLEYRSWDTLFHIQC